MHLAEAPLERTALASASTFPSLVVAAVMGGGRVREEKNVQVRDASGAPCLL